MIPQAPVADASEPLPPAVSSEVLRNMPRDADNPRPIRRLGTIIDDLDAPTWQRDRDEAAMESAEAGDAAVEDQYTISEDAEDTYEIPAFLRKSAG